MYVVRNKATHEILHIDYSAMAKSVSGEEVYSGFDAVTMEVGWTSKSYIPIYFDIDEDGEVVEISVERQVSEGLRKLAPAQKLVDGRIVQKSLDELLTEGIVELGQLKGNKIETFSRLAFDLRQKLISDYQLNNAALGVYGEARRIAYQATVEAFRDEFYRLKTALEAAATLTELEAVIPRFPTSIMDGN